MNRAAELLASAKKNLTRAQIERNRKDAERAKKKADYYQQVANTLTIQFPAVVKTCPSAPPLCVTVDRGHTLDSLRALYANQRNSTQRTVARTYWRNINRTKRNDRLVVQAKALEQAGIVEITKLPRVAVECK
jgi:predicted Mrr-cat superfamily restriction endonuclease